MFGGGELTTSLGKYTFPVYFMDDKNELHSANLAMEVVEQDIIMLMGANSLKNGDAIIDIGNQKMSFPKVFPNTQFPLIHPESGHFNLNFFISSRQEGLEAARSVLTDPKWNSDTASHLIHYVKTSIKPEFKDVATGVFLTRKAKTKRKGNFKSNSLNQKDINKLHHLFGHAHPDKLENLIRTSGRLNDNVKACLEKLKDCEVCKIEGRRLSKPKVALPKAHQHNHVVSIDLKENTRYPNSMPYILYMVDCFSRFKVRDKMSRS